MFNNDGKNKIIQINGTSVDVSTKTVEELNSYLQELEIKRKNIITRQNDCLSKIID